MQFNFLSNFIIKKSIICINEILKFFHPAGWC